MLIRVCTGPACTKNFSSYTLERAEIEAAKDPALTVKTCGCLGQCEKGPNVVIEMNNKKNLHHYVNGTELKRLIRKKN